MRPDPDTFQEHALVDFRKFGTNQIKKKSDRLRRCRSRTRLEVPTLDSWPILQHLSRIATIPSGSTTSYTIPNLDNGTEYMVRVTATRTDASDGPPSREVTGTPTATP